MPSLWRLYRARHGPGLDGSGGLFADGRWHKQGERVVYFGGSPAIVVLERLAHTDADLLPNDLRLARFEFSEPVLVTKVEDFASLPARWDKDENVTRKIGSQWRQQGASCLLSVPSAILPEGRNFVLNPEHSDSQRLRLVHQRPFAFALDLAWKRLNLGDTTRRHQNLLKANAQLQSQSRNPCRCRAMLASRSKYLPTLSRAVLCPTASQLIGQQISLPQHRPRPRFRTFFA